MNVCDRFWLIFLAIMSTFALLYSLAVIAMPPIRQIILVRRFRFGTPSGVSALISKTQVNNTTRMFVIFLSNFLRNLYIVSRRLQIGDFLLLHFLGQNMSQMCFGELLDDLSNKLHIDSMNDVPTAPSTLELNPMYPSDKLKLHKETEA